MSARALVCVAFVVAASCKPRTPTYHHDVAPILARHCRECHHAGGVAPVPTLADYESARMYAQPIKLSVQTRRMPPWGVDNTGLCGTWQDARWLTSDEIATLARWQEAGSPEGPPAPEPSTATREIPFRRDASVDIGGEYKPGLGVGGNHCFVVDPGLDRDRLLTAVRLVSTDARSVAQVTLFALDSDAGEADAAARDAAEVGLGYSCYGTTRTSDARVVASWTWPTPVLRMPAGTGVRLHAHRKMVVQVHYDIMHLGSISRPDTSVELELDDTAHEVRVVAVAATGLLPPAQRYVAVENSQPLGRRVRLVAVAPRMHIRGQQMQLTVDRGSQSRCVADFDHWHFEDQQLFRARDPITLDAEDRLHVRCVFATLGREKPIVFGDDIDDEECVAYVFVMDER